MLGKSPMTFADITHVSVEFARKAHLVTSFSDSRQVLFLEKLGRFDVTGAIRGMTSTRPKHRA
jgi:hypothetical protein